MGCCCSCLKGDGAESNESEMTSTSAAEARGKSLVISQDMSAPTIEIAQDQRSISGNGLALAGVSIEQDAAYWEWHIKIETDGSEDTMFGVSTRKDAAFYRRLEEQDDATPQTDGTALMKKVPIKDGDTVGVAVQQSDLPMIQFLVNGEPLHELAINRFRGSVYPACCLPPGERVEAKLVFEEGQYTHLSPHPRFGPVIVARGII